MNKSTFLGRLTKEIEPKATQNGAMCSFTLACDSGYNKETKEVKTEFVPFKAFGRNAEILADYVKVGQRVLIEDARYQQRRVDNDNGISTYYHTFIVEKFKLIEKRED